MTGLLVAVLILFLTSFVTPLTVGIVVVVLDHEYDHLSPKLAKSMVVLGTLLMPRRLRIEHRAVLLQDIDDVVAEGSAVVSHGLSLAFGALRQVKTTWAAQLHQRSGEAPVSRVPLSTIVPVGLILRGEDHDDEPKYFEVRSDGSVRAVYDTRIEDDWVIIPPADGREFLEGWGVTSEVLDEAWADVRQ